MKLNLILISIKYETRFRYRNNFFPTLSFSLHLHLYIYRILVCIVHTFFSSRKLISEHGMHIIHPYIVSTHFYRPKICQKLMTLWESTLNQWPLVSGQSIFMHFSWVFLLTCYLCKHRLSIKSSWTEFGFNLFPPKRTHQIMFTTTILLL